MDDSDVFSSPSKGRSSEGEEPKQPSNQDAPFDAEEAREVALRRELEGVRKINEAIEGVIGTLERARENMGVRPPSPVYSPTRRMLTRRNRRYPRQ